VSFGHPHRLDLDPADDTADADWSAFAALEHMTNHWDRPDWPPGRTAYYWYLDFTGYPDLKELALHCQAVIAGEQFDPVAADELHMTLAKIACADEIDQAKLNRIARAAGPAVAGFGAIPLMVGPLAGSRGALSFSVSPRATIDHLRASLVRATRAAGCPVADTSGSFRPHVGIAYCNRTTDARPIIKQVSKLRELDRVTTHVRECVLVALTRHERSYSWKVRYRLPLDPAR
jgi:2'-5' RNA ligase